MYMLKRYNIYKRWSVNCRRFRNESLVCCVLVIGCLCADGWDSLLFWVLCVLISDSAWYEQYKMCKQILLKKSQTWSFPKMRPVGVALLSATIPTFLYSNTRLLCAAGSTCCISASLRLFIYRETGFRFSHGKGVLDLATRVQILLFII